MKKGFTLVEVVIAAALLAITIGGLLAAITTARRSALLSGTRLAAMQIARQQMETLLSYSFASAPQLTLGTHTISPVTQLVYGSRSISTGLFNGSYVISTNKQFSEVLVKNIDLTIFWTNPTLSRSSSVNLQGSISRPLHP